MTDRPETDGSVSTGPSTSRVPTPVAEASGRDRRGGHRTPGLRVAGAGASRRGRRGGDVRTMGFDAWASRPGRRRRGRDVGSETSGRGRRGGGLGVGAEAETLGRGVRTAVHGLSLERHDVRDAQPVNVSSVSTYFELHGGRREKSMNKDGHV